MRWIRTGLLEVETIDYEEFLNLMGESGSTKLKRQKQDKDNKPKATPSTENESNRDFPPKLGSSRQIAPVDPSASCGVLTVALGPDRYTHRYTESHSRRPCLQPPAPA